MHHEVVHLVLVEEGFMGVPERLGEEAILAQVERGGRGRRALLPTSGAREPDLKDTRAAIAARAAPADGEKVKEGDAFVEV